MKTLVEKLDLSPANFYTNKDRFIKELDKDTEFTPFGELVHSYTVEKGKGLSTSLQGNIPHGKMKY